MSAGSDDDETDAAPIEKTFDPRMLEALVCPQCHAVLSYDAQAQELISKAAHLAYPIRAGIPVLLIDEARSIDKD